MNRPDLTATSQPAAQAAPIPDASFVGKEPTEEAIEAGLKEQAAADCRYTLADIRKGPNEHVKRLMMRDILIAAYKVDGISSAISDTGGDG